MALVIQPYNGWREKLAADILGPIISGVIQRSQQNADNRKYNAMLGEYANMMGQSQQQQATPSLLAGLEQTSSNGWENAFRKGSNELANFDMNTAGAVPQITPSVQPFNQAQAFQNLFTLLGNPRFSHLNTSEAINRMAPMLQAMENQRMTDLRNQYATGLQGANSFDDQVNLIMRAAMEGAANDNTVNSMVDYAKYRQPNYRFSEMDTGDKKYLLAGNPATGQVTPMFNAKVGVSPNTRATLDTNRYIADQTADLKRAELADTRLKNERDYSIKDRIQTEVETQGAYNRNNPELKMIPSQSGAMYIFNNRTGELVEARGPDGTVIKDPQTLRALKTNARIVQDENGNYFVVDTVEGNATPVTTPDGQQVKGQPKTTTKTPNPNQDMTESQKLEIGQLNKELDEARKQRDKYMSQMETFSDEPDSPEYKSAKANAERYIKRIDEIKKEKQKILQGNNSQPQNAPSVTPKAPVTSRDVKPSAPSTASPDVTPRPPVTSNDVPPTITPSPISGDMEPPVGADVTPTPPTPVSPDVPSAPIVTPQPESGDVRPSVPPTASPDVTPRAPESGDVKPAPSEPNKQPKKELTQIAIGDLPPEAVYDPERDKNVPQDKIYTKQQFGALIAKIIEKNPVTAKILSPLTIAYKLIKNGARIKI